MESEFLILELANNEALWLENFFAYIPLGMKPYLSMSMSMHYDS